LTTDVHLVLMVVWSCSSAPTIRLHDGLGIEFSGVGTMVCVPVRLALRPTQSPAQWVQGFFPGVKGPVWGTHSLF